MSYENRNLTIMIAENDRTILELLQIRLMVAGYGSCHARTGPLALETLKSFRPAALILDLNLPEMDGFAILEALHMKRGRLDVPTLVMGRNLSAEDITRAIRLGARDCLAKPFSGHEVIDRITRMLRKPQTAGAAGAVAAA
jgi:DNA-binding response OmpR family regulator